MTFSKEIIEILNYLGTKFGVAIDWTSQNVTPYIKELIEKYLSWEIATSTMWLVIGSLIVIAGIILFICDITIDWYGIGIVIGIGVCIMGVPIIIIQILDILKCTYFPELQVIEYIKYLSGTINP